MTDDTGQAKIAIRRLWQFDQLAIRRHFQRLDKTTRRMRFGGAVSDAFIEKYVANIFQIGSVVYGAFMDGRLCGIAELRGLLDDWPMTAEAAFSVEREWQDQGIGQALLARIVAAAQNRGLKRLHMICLMHNGRMKHIAAKHGALLEFHLDEVTAKLDPPWPTPSSLVEEISGETSGLMHSLLYWPDSGGGR